MKNKFLYLLLCTSLTFSLFGCGKTSVPPDSVSLSELENLNEKEEPIIENKKEDDQEDKKEIIFESIVDEDRPYHEYEEIPDKEFSFIKEIKNSSLPRIDIMTEETIFSKYDYNTCTIKISNTEYGFDEQEAKIKLRGNSTACLPKIPVKIKFADKTSMFGLEEEKEWTLLANAYDKTLIHNYITYNLYSELSDNFESRCIFVDLYVNNQYAGVYNLCDQVAVSKNRINITKDIENRTPEEMDYLIVQDKRASWNDPELLENIDWFWASATNDSFEMKNPKTDDENYTEDYTKYIKNYLDTAYYYIDNKNWEKVQEYVDIDSFIVGGIVNQISKNQDCNKSSLYFTKTADGRLKFCTLWDADLTYGCGEIGNASTDEEGIMDNSFYSKLMNIPEFKNLYIDYYKENRDYIFNYLNEQIDNIILLYGNELQNDYDQWESGINYCNEDMKTLSYENQIIYLKQWIVDRFAYLDSLYL